MGGDERWRVHDFRAHLEELCDDAENVEVDAVREEEVPKLDDFVQPGGEEHESKSAIDHTRSRRRQDGYARRCTGTQGKDGCE